MEGINLDGLVLIRESARGVGGLDVVQWLATRVGSALEVSPSEATSKFCQQERWTTRYFNESTSLSEFFGSLAQDRATSTSRLVFVDWLELLALEHGVDFVLNALYNLKGSACTCLLIRPATERLIPFNRLTSLADSIIELRIEGANRIASTTVWSKNGKRTSSEEVIVFNAETHKFTCTRYVTAPTVIQETPAAQSVPSLATSFDMGLNLRDSERAAKESMQLPYMRMQNEQGLVDIRMTGSKKVRVGGQIIYTPDEGDDLDDSDPDDDLNL